MIPPFTDLNGWIAQGNLTPFGGAIDVEISSKTCGGFGP